MNSRSLSPFLISLAVFFAALSGSRVCAQSVGISALAALRSAPAGSSARMLPLSAPLAVAAPVSLHTLSREQAVAALLPQLVEHFSLEGDLQLEWLRPWIEPAPSATPFVLVITEFPIHPASSLLLRARLESAGASLGEVTLMFRAQLLRDVWVTRQPVNRGDLLDPAALDVRRVDVLREREVLPAATVDRDLTFARSVSAGRILTWRDVTRRSLVCKGDLVEVAAVEGALTITMKALALQNGAAGEIVTVRNLESKKDIVAQVVAENRVQVRF